MMMMKHLPEKHPGNCIRIESTKHRVHSEKVKRESKKDKDINTKGHRTM